MSIQQYKDQQTDQKDSFIELVNLSSNSKVSIFNLWFYIVAFVANSLKELYDIHEQEIVYLIDNQKIGSLNYYRTIVLAFRDGHTFDRETLQYIGNYTEAEIAEAQIVKRAAIQSITNEGRKQLFLKLATEDSEGNLQKIESDVLDRISAYMYPNINAGTYIEYFSDKADDLRIELDVYIDNTILSADGVRIDGTSNSPIPDAINSFLANKNFKFDGELVLSQLENAIQVVSGVESEAVRFEKVEASYQTPLSWEIVKERYTARSGYYQLLDENLKINYLIKE
tara:strand:- start:291 stop:1139 length:849 start_codon:yes stop_codon:yes gene_type:complete